VYWVQLMLAELMGIALHAMQHGPQDEVYTVADSASPSPKVQVFADPRSLLAQPYMVVNIGSGVSFLKVSE
jgi:pantothenate kinase